MLQYAALAVTAVTLTVSSWGGGWPLYAEWALLAALAVLYWNWPQRRYHLYMVTQLLLVLALVWLEPMGAVLGFTYSVHAMMLFPGRTGVGWIAALAVLSGAVIALAEGLVEGVLIGLGFGLGYFSFGYANLLYVRSERAHRESQHLLEELQAAHDQLKTYADEVEELAVTRERNRLAREMHDTLGHHLTVAAVQLEGVQRLIPGDPERAVAMVTTVRQQVREALSELRSTVATLRSPVEADLSLPLALTRLVNSFQQSTGLGVHLSLPQDLPAVPGAQRSALYRAAQEALTNVQRHGQAHQAWVTLAVQDGALLLEVRDDGVGLPDSAEARGFGLRGLRERAMQLGGEATWSPLPEGGTRLSFRVPLAVED
jgi:signal transduction histidine kinase